MCVCVFVRDSEIGFARVTPEDEKMTRKAENMKGRVKTAERNRKIKHFESAHLIKSSKKKLSWKKKW